MYHKLFIRIASQLTKHWWSWYFVKIATSIAMAKLKLINVECSGTTILLYVKLNYLSILLPIRSSGCNVNISLIKTMAVTCVWFHVVCLLSFPSMLLYTILYLHGTESISAGFAYKVLHSNHIKIHWLLYIRYRICFRCVSFSFAFNIFAMLANQNKTKHYSWFENKRQTKHQFVSYGTPAPH